MIQGQKEPSTQRRLLACSTLLQRHPVLTPLVLLSSALLLGIVGIFTDTLFLELSLVGVSVSTLDVLILFCLLIAFVLGIVGVLASIIGILEQLDRYGSISALPLPLFVRLKEQSYANRN